MGMPRSSYRHQAGESDQERLLIQRMTELALQYGRYGFRRITVLLLSEGWEINHNCIERIWRKGGLKVPQCQLKEGQLWLKNGDCVRLRPEHKNHVWSYDFVNDRTRDGRALRMLTILDE